MATVHPHARGEHKRHTIAAVPGGGSSPRPWGTPECCSSVHLSSRFIPTPVGNTSFPFFLLLLLSVHPHARGEHNGAFACAVHWGGSSPRPWGTRGALHP